MVDPNSFEYTIGFVPAGNYVVAYTCDSDDVETDAERPDEPNGDDESSSSRRRTARR